MHRTGLPPPLWGGAISRLGEDCFKALEGGGGRGAWRTWRMRGRAEGPEEEEKPDDKHVMRTDCKPASLVVGVVVSSS